MGGARGWGERGGQEGCIVQCGVFGVVCLVLCVMFSVFSVLNSVFQQCAGVVFTVCFTVYMLSVGVLFVLRMRQVCGQTLTVAQ